MLGEEGSVRTRLVELARRFRAGGLLAGASGNLSARLGDGRVLITPAGGFKDEARPEELLLVDAAGHVLAGSGTGAMSSEGRMHLALYRRHPSVRAVMHTHAPAATAIGCAEAAPDLGITAEGVAALGPVVVVPWVVPGGEELAVRVAQAADRGWTLLLRNHGVVTCGASADDAAARMESLEHVARIYTHAIALGRCRVIPDADRDALLAQYGWPERLPGWRSG